MLVRPLQQIPRIHKLLVSALTLVVIILSLVPSDPASASRNTQGLELEPGIRYDLSLALQHQEIDLDQLLNEPDWQRVTVRSGDNLAKIFNRLGLSAQEVYKVSHAGKDAKKLLKMMPGDELLVLTDQNGQFHALQYPFNKTQTLHIERQNDDEFVSTIDQQQTQNRLAYAQGQIESSFWNAGVKAGMSEAQIMNLAGIFGWDIDFALELRQGDHFNVVYEEQYLDGEFLGYGPIVAAEFTNQGETFTAIRYTDGNYYTPEGRSMRKSFLRAPVDFTRISDSFNPRRYHPVQKRYKAHRGVDYAAPTGTPVIAAGDGKVVRAGYDKYNGHHVFIQHGEKYTTKYIHFSKRKAKLGQFVKQGQVIGYVGSTGLASGPHLHFEFLVDGVHRNPRTVELPKADPIARKELTAFQGIAKDYLQHLDNNRRIMLAMASPTQTAP